jgi:hypothetical protein
MQRIWMLLAVVFSAIFGGCSDPPEGVPPALPSGQPANLDDWLVVTSDANAIAAAQSRAEKFADDAFERIIASAAGPGAFPDSEDAAILGERKKEAVERLLRLVSPKSPTIEPVGAAQWLCRWGMPEGRAYFAHALRTGKTAVRKQVLHAVAGGSFSFDARQRKHITGFSLPTPSWSQACSINWTIPTRIS